VASDEADGGLAAIDACLREPPDLVLMDVQMPGLDGLQTCVQLRALQREGQLPDFPIIALTAHALPGDREASLAAGMDDHLTKPIDPTTLRQALERWLPPHCRLPPEPPPPAPSPATTATDLPFDHPALLRRLDQDQALLRTVLGVFLDDLPKQLRTLEAAVSQDHRPQVADLAHKVKGAAANLCAQPLSQAAAELERAARDPAAPPLQPHLQLLHNAFQRLESMMRKVL
jgi:two-component system, sensor histidine kinase and response regulator